ncbi:sulfite exporter TauE/SafE family protein, partial [Salmonella enterica]|nr:sulfite exporter TauE/SafE family protein [Salmonella enterica]
LIASGAMLIKGALGVSAATALLPPFVLLAILQILLGKKIAEIRKVDASK